MPTTTMPTTTITQIHSLLMTLPQCPSTILFEVINLRVHLQCQTSGVQVFGLISPGIIFGVSVGTLPQCFPSSGLPGS